MFNIGSMHEFARYSYILPNLMYTAARLREREVWMNIECINRVVYWLMYCWCWLVEHHCWLMVNYSWSMYYYWGLMVHEWCTLNDDGSTMYHDIWPMIYFGWRVVDYWRSSNNNCVLFSPCFCLLFLCVRKLYAFCVHYLRVAF